MSAESDAYTAYARIQALLGDDSYENNGGHADDLYEEQVSGRL